MHHFICSLVLPKGLEYTSGFRDMEEHELFFKEYSTPADPSPGYSCRAHDGPSQVAGPFRRQRQVGSGRCYTATRTLQSEPSVLGCLATVPPFRTLRNIPWSVTQGERLTVYTVAMVWLCSLGDLGFVS